MKSTQLLKKVPFLKPLDLSEEEVLMVLMRIGGNLEAMQGFKNNPEIGVRINENEQKLLQHCGQIILGLQAKICNFVSQEEKDQMIAGFHQQLVESNNLIAVLTDQKSQLMDELEKLRS
jgi:hypothetical protein